VLAPVMASIARVLFQTREQAYLILGTGKSCERAIAEAVIVEEIIGQQKQTK
jgi:hypothetical protein